MRCTRTAGAASAVPLAFMPFDMLQTTCILTTCGCSGMLAMYRRRDDQRESLDWQSRGQAFGARALNPIECGPLPANVSFLSVLDDKTSQMLFVLWRQVALVKGHFFERTASCMKKRLSSPLLKCIPQTWHGNAAKGAGALRVRGGGPKWEQTRPPPSKPIVQTGSFSTM